MIANLACRPSPVCALAVTNGYPSPYWLPTLLEDGAPIPDRGMRSTGGSRYTDDAFSICDV